MYIYIYLSLSLSLYMYIYIHTYIYVYIYIYIHALLKTNSLENDNAAGPQALARQRRPLEEVSFQGSAKLGVSQPCASARAWRFMGSYKWGYK